MKISGSKPRQLIPYVNQEGILRFRGRLKFANITEDVKHQITPLHPPPLPPPSNHHHISGDMGTEPVVANFRKK